MVPKQQYEQKENNLDTSSEAEEEYESELEEGEAQLEYHTEESEDEELEGGVSVAQNGIAEEYHTDTSDDIDSEDTDDSVNVDIGAPYLPAHLLQPALAPKDVAAQIPHERSLREAGKAVRNSQRRGKKQTYEALQQEAKKTGALAAGKAAQIKRGVVLEKDKVKSGRISKSTTRTAKPQLSGRQKILESRVRMAGGTPESVSESRPAGLSKSGRRRWNKKQKQKLPL